MASSVAFKPIDPKRDEFRRYLERSGVIEALTKVVIRLVKERPKNPLEYLRSNLGDAKQEADEYAYLQKELEEARSEIERLRKIIESVKPDALLDHPNKIATTKSESTNGVETSKEQISAEETVSNEEKEEESNTAVQESEIATEELPDNAEN